MYVYHIPDHTGHSTLKFTDQTNAQEKFEKLIAEGRTPIIREKDGDNRRIPNTFDPEHREILFVQPVAGG